VSHEHKVLKRISALSGKRIPYRPSKIAYACLPDARRRRSGGGPGEGYARMPVGTYLYLHAVVGGNRRVKPCTVAWHI
jgi:hypothetical protein